MANLTIINLILIIILYGLVFLIFKNIKKKHGDGLTEITSTQTMETPFHDVTIPEIMGKEIVGEIELFVQDDPVSTLGVSEIPIKIGRDPSKADIILTEPIVSKHHCTIFKKEDSNSVFVMDHGSTNGVFVNDEKVTEAEVKDGDSILLGKKGVVRIVYHTKKSE